MNSRLHPIAKKSRPLVPNPPFEPPIDIQTPTPPGIKKSEAENSLVTYWSQKPCRKLPFL
jgi:hypothetical protein